MKHEQTRFVRHKFDVIVEYFFGVVKFAQNELLLKYDDHGYCRRAKFCVISVSIRKFRNYRIALMNIS